MIDLFSYHRRATTAVHVGGVTIGGASAIAIQSMTTTPTADVAASVAQAERIADAGGQLVRLTTQGVREAESLRHIAAAMCRDGYDVPLVADVHFNARVADVAALYADKVRINPGNYVDGARTFRQIEYSDAEYAAEVSRIEERLLPFIAVCRQHHTAVRIGVNHGSLSDRIMSRYGDTPEGIVESCMEFLRVFRRERFDDVVVSIKASNTVVMVRSVRLLVSRMEAEGMSYPLHLGVTEAGEGEDGRIKSAVGIGALLVDGIGDTIRVSLSEEPEAELPVARALVSYVSSLAERAATAAAASPQYDWLQPERRRTRTTNNIGGDAVPVVIACGDGLDIERMDTDRRPDYVYIGDDATLAVSPVATYIARPAAADILKDKAIKAYPLYKDDELEAFADSDAAVRFLLMTPASPMERCLSVLKRCANAVAVLRVDEGSRVHEGRRVAHAMTAAGVDAPLVFLHTYDAAAVDDERRRLHAAVDASALMTDGLVDGLWLWYDGGGNAAEAVRTAFAILQAARLRITHTEYISCPGCGRTLYDLRSTIARVKAATAHMRGLKIAVMGCIVNGPGEMADADYGYVGAGPGRISLYRRQECVERAIDEGDAVEHLLRLIRKDEDRQA